MKTTEIKIRIDDETKRKFQNTCGRRPMSRVLLSLIRQYITTKEKTQ